MPIADLPPRNHPATRGGVQPASAAAIRSLRGPGQRDAEREVARGGLIFAQVLRMMSSNFSRRVVGMLGGEARRARARGRPGRRRPRAPGPRGRPVGRPWPPAAPTRADQRRRRSRRRAAVRGRAFALAPLHGPAPAVVAGAVDRGTASRGIAQRSRCWARAARTSAGDGAGDQARDPALDAVGVERFGGAAGDCARDRRRGRGRAPPRSGEVGRG